VQTIRALPEAARVLKPGGRIRFSVYNRHFWPYRQEPYADHPGGLRLYRWNLHLLKQLANETGFRIARIGYYRTLPSTLGRFYRHSAEGAIYRLDRTIAAVPGLRRYVSRYLLSDWQRSPPI
jgi:hypothetical protein